SAKIDIDELATLFRSRGRATGKNPGEAGANASDLPSRLRAIWREVLQNDDIGFDDPFVDAGGDSLSIMLLIARLDEDFGYELSLWEVFDNLTVGKLCMLMQGETV